MNPVAPILSWTCVPGYDLPLLLLSRAFDFTIASNVFMTYETMGLSCRIVTRCGHCAIIIVIVELSARLTTRSWI